MGQGGGNGRGAARAVALKLRSASAAEPPGSSRTLWEVDRDAGVDATLAVQEGRLVGVRREGAVPDVRADVEAVPTVAPEGDERLGRHVIAGRRERDDEALAVHREDQLAAVGMVVGAPDQRPLAGSRRPVGDGFLGQAAPAEEVAVADGVVARKERVAAPGELEEPLGHPALIARVGVHRAPALRRPAHDLDRKQGRIVDEAAQAVQAVGRRHDQRSLVQPPHACGGSIGDLVHVHGGLRGPARYGLSAVQSYSNSAIRPKSMCSCW